MGELSINHFKRDSQLDEALSSIKVLFQSSEIGFIATERLNQINIIVTNGMILLQKKKGVFNFIALRSESLSSLAVVTNTMHPGP